MTYLVAAYVARIGGRVYRWTRRERVEGPPGTLDVAATARRAEWRASHTRGCSVEWTVLVEPGAGGFAHPSREPAP